MKKTLKYLKQNIMGFVVGGIIFGSFGVCAATVIAANNIGYSDNNNLGADNVQEAIDKLYDKTFTKKKILGYEYHETGINKCINGEEKTCKLTTCYENKSVNSCIQGTIIKYYVNDTEQKVFYVLHDDGATMTMQQRENTVRNIPWYEENDNTKGPLTILSYLEAATSTWSNVEFQEYTAGYTNFYENAYTGCSYSTSNYKITCSANKYNNDSNNLTLSKRKVRARMITAQEVNSTGCLVYKDSSKNSTILGNSIDANNCGSCPDFMHNYLHQSTLYGGSYDNDSVNENGYYDNDYWTMSASIGSTSAILVDAKGYISSIYPFFSHYGARAVVVISK